MNLLLKILGQLSDSERKDFTSWFSTLSQKEQSEVASKLPDVDTARLILSIPEKERISLFLINKTPEESFNEKLEAWNKNIWDKVRKLREEKANKKP